MSQDKYQHPVECEKVDSVHKPLLCRITDVPCQEEASVLLSLEFCWNIIFFLSACDCRSVGFTVDSYQIFLDKILDKFSMELW